MGAAKSILPSNDTIFLAHQEIASAFHGMLLRLKSSYFLSDLNGDLKVYAAEAGLHLAVSIIFIHSEKVTV